MTNLLTVLPDFDAKQYTHILPSLEKAQISIADLLTLDAVDVAKRAQVPSGEVRRLTDNVIDSLRAGTNGSSHRSCDGNHLINSGEVVSTLDDTLDGLLNGGIATGHVTELVGESAAGKTQVLLTLLLSAQLSAPYGLSKGALYVSTEAPLQTTRLSQILRGHPKLKSVGAQGRPSLNRIQSTHIHDLEAQDHILRFQVPVIIKRHDIGLLVIDSIAANYRSEFDKGNARKSAAASISRRSKQVAQLGALLRAIAQEHNVAVVVSNQVADRFTTMIEPASQGAISTPKMQSSRPDTPSHGCMSQSSLLSQHLPLSNPSDTLAFLTTDDPLALDHQQCFFTGWGDDSHVTNLKTPTLGITWTNQLSTRIALLKYPITGTDGSVLSWKRTFKVVFSAWCRTGTAGFEITEGGVSAV
ncbi:MAG: hypothetical protein FE78DRAFT_126049, partial [Acidomyces sp. 'richmondensis']